MTKYKYITILIFITKISHHGDNMENEKYDIEKLAETNNRERKMSHDFDDDDDLGMDFFKTMEEIYRQINKNEQKTTSELPNF